MLERNDEAQDVRWCFFEKTLNLDYLRAYLKRLPDFEDFEAEQKGLAWAAGHQSAERALAFFTAWPNLEQAARLVRNRLSNLNGAVYLRPSAEALEEKYPVAASLLYRRMVESVLNRGSSKQYPYAAEDLQSRDRLAGRIAGDDQIETHATFLARRKKRMGASTDFGADSMAGRNKADPLRAQATSRSEPCLIAMDVLFAFHEVRTRFLGNIATPSMGASPIQLRGRRALRLPALNDLGRGAAARRSSAIDRRTTRHDSYAVSQRIRKRIEEAFGWIKTVAGQEKTRFRGRDRVGWAFTFTAAAYNVVRLPKLIAEAG